MTAPKQRAKFDDLQARHAKAYERYLDEQIAQRRKYGSTGYLVYATKTESDRLDRLSRKLDIILDQMLALLADINPAVDWTVGIGIATICNRLTFDEAVAGVKP